jgi:hypothetical protein
VILGPNLTTADPVIGWETIQPTRRPVDPHINMALRVWALRNQAIEDGLACGQWDHNRIEELAALATNLQRIAAHEIECQCVLPEQSCVVCRSVAHATLILAETGG